MINNQEIEILINFDLRAFIVLEDRWLFESIYWLKYKNNLDNI